MRYRFSCDPCRVQSPTAFRPGCPGCKAREVHLARIKEQAQPSPSLPHRPA